MYAVIESGSKQFRIEPESVIRVEKIEGQVGDKVILDRILFVGDENAVHVGKPLIKGALVESRIVAQGRARKVTIFKFKKRKGYHKKQGHRQPFTSLKITDIHPPIP